MSLSNEDLLQKMESLIATSEKRTAAKIDSAVEAITLQTAQGFNEVTERFKQSDENTAELINGLAGHVDDRFANADKKLDDVKDAFDGLASNYQKLAKEDVASSVVQSRHDEQLKDHERRLTRLEPVAA